MQELSPSDKLKKQTQDLLQAELTSTLKRRKPVVINEPKKYEYPTYDDSNKNNESSHTNGNANYNNNGINNGINNSVNNNNNGSVPIAQQKPLNVSAVLSVVTGIKLPDIQYDANISASKPPSSNTDKMKITHGKPNFTVSQKENRPNVPSTSPKLQSTSSDTILSKYRRPSDGGSTGVNSAMTTEKVHNVKTTDTKTFNGNSFNVKPVNVNPTDAKTPSNGKFIDVKPLDSKSVNVKISDLKSANVKPMPYANSESQVKKCKSIFLLKSQNSIENDNSVLKKLPSKTELISKFDNAPISNVTVNVYTPKKELKKQTSVDGTSNGISFVSVANKKALFEKPAQSETIPRSKCAQASGKPTTTLEISNGKFNTLNGHRIISPSSNQANRNNNGGSGGDISNGVTTVSVNKNISYGSMNQAPTKDRIDQFERTTHTMNETTSTNKRGQLETRQFEQTRQFVSFSKDLLNAPNNYPDQIRVKKTIVTERSNIATAASTTTGDNPFHNIRFSIQSNGQVIPKAK